MVGVLGEQYFIEVGPKAKVPASTCGGRPSLMFAAEFKEQLKNRFWGRMLSEVMREVSGCLKVVGAIGDAEVGLEFPQLQEKPLVGLEARPAPEGVSKGVVEGGAILVHHVGEEEGGRAGNAGRAVDEHVSPPPLLLYKPKHGEEGEADFLVLSITKIEEVHQNCSIVGDSQVYG